MSGLLGGARSSSKPQDMRNPALAAPETQFASILLGLLGAQGAQRGSTRGSGADPVAFVSPASDVLGGIPRHQGPLAAPITPGELAALNDVNALATDPVRRAQLAATMRGDFLDPTQGFLSEFAAAANRATTRQFEETMTRVLPSAFTRANQNINPGQSSAFDRAAAIQSEGFANDIADSNARIFAENYQAERARQLQAVQFSQDEVEKGIATLQANALPRLIDQFGLDQGLAEFSRASQTLIQVLSILQGLSAPAIGNIQSQRQDTGVIPGLVQPLAGAAGGYLALKGQ